MDTYNYLYEFNRHNAIYRNLIDIMLYEDVRHKIAQCTNACTLSSKIGKAIQWR